MTSSAIREGRIAPPRHPRVAGEAIKPAEEVAEAHGMHGALGAPRAHGALGSTDHPQESAQPRTQHERGDVPSGSVHLSLPALRVLGDFVMKPGTGLAEREIPDYELLYFPEGTGTIYSIGQREYALRQPCFVITRPGERHAYRYDEQVPTRHLFVHFLLRKLPGEALPLLRPDGPSVVAYAGGFLDALMRQLLTIAHANPERLQERGGPLLLALLTELHCLSGDGLADGASERRPPQIEQALRAIEQTVPAPLAVEALARRVGWTPEHLSRSFVRHVGCTPKEAITRRRIDLACQLLLHGQRSVKEIAFEVGFADQNYFSRVFKATKAVTASAYRRKHQHPRYAALAFGPGGDSPYPSNRVFFGER